VKPREQGIGSLIKSLKGKSTEELETLLADVQSRENQALEPLTREKSALQKLLRERLNAVVSSASQAGSYDTEGTGLPVAPIIYAPEAPVGDVNLLMNTVPLTTAPFDRILMDTARTIVTITGGIMPEMEVRPMSCGMHKDNRIVAKWTIPRAITVEELFHIERLVRGVYERQISGHKKGNGWEKITCYADLLNTAHIAKQGIYFGPDGNFNSQAMGVLVYRRFVNEAEAKFLTKTHPEDWLTRSIEKTVTKTEIELREGTEEKDKKALRQDKFLQLVIQLSYLFAKRKPIDNRTFMIAIYRALNRVGTNNIERDKLYGMKETLTTIERVLILALQRPDLAQSYQFRPESVLLVGVPGTGKTFLSHYLMTSDYNAIFISVDSGLLKEGLASMSNFFLRIDIIKNATLLPVVLLIDDVDGAMEKDDLPKFLNLMQGIRQKGFHIVASTNHPEKIDRRLLEPGRFSKIIHVGLPSRADRVGVLANHLANLPFESEQEKQTVIEDMAKRTVGWTQRYLWAMCTEAGRFCGLQVDASGTKPVVPLSRQHFYQAHAELLKSINTKELKEWDQNIAAFVSRATKQIGF
jgi:hypothetical protein